MLLKKSLVLAIDLIMCKETGPKINIGGGVGGSAEKQGIGTRE
jgi:hypothetical protein